MRVFSKSVKMLILTLLSVITVSVSAATYYSMVMQPAVTITGATIRFVTGSDWPNGSQLGDNGTYVKLALNAYPNATLTYDEPLNISNTDGADHQFRLRHVSITPTTGSASVSNFTFINFVVKNASGVPQASFNYTTSADNWNTPSATSYMTLPANTQWIIYVETKATASANGNIVANIQIAVDVQE